MKKTAHLLFLICFVASFTIISCDDEAEPTAQISINETGSDLGGDVTGNGGSETNTFTWNNPQQTADWNMDITAAGGGSLRLTITDAGGQTVLNQTLQKGQSDDSRSGVTSTGTAGDWLITVSVTDFNGDGSFSLSPGN